MGLIAHDKRHGGAFDCGGADNWYSRPFAPHFWSGGTGKSLRIGAEGMTGTEIAAYAAGWADNEESGGKKEWG
jgi:hypothetical protein